MLFDNGLQIFISGNPSEKLDDKILREYVRQYIDDIFVENGEQPSIHLLLINNDTRQYFFNIFEYFSIFFNIFQYF
jgi:hypothetical protein